MGLKPGQKAPKSGQYGVVGPRGGKINHEVTVVKGEPMPPTKKPGQTYVLNDFNILFIKNSVSIGMYTVEIISQNKVFL